LSGRRDIEALLRQIALRRAIPHSWKRGECCVSFAFACVEAQTGIDWLADIGWWTNWAEARRVARSIGGLKVALDDRLTRIAPAFAQRGDVAGLPDKAFGVRLMIVEGATLVGPGERGLEHLPRSAMRLAWSAVG